MKHKAVNWWTRKGSIGVLTVPDTSGHRIHEPEFVPLDELERLLNDLTLKGLIIQGTGRHFSSGADLAVLRDMTRQEGLLAEKITHGKLLIQTIESLCIPTVAFVRGVCFGAGLEIALACHIRICSKNALFAFPEIHHGIMPGLGGSVMLTRLVGPGKSAEIILSGDTLNAEKALNYGIVNYIAPKDHADNFALEYLEKLTGDRSVNVIHAVIQSIRNARNLHFRQALEEETKLFCALATGRPEES